MLEKMRSSVGVKENGSLSLLMSKMCKVVLGV